MSTGTKTGEGSGHIDLFAACLAEKLATFATGRVPNYAERHELRALARAACAPGRGFRDLVLDLIDSRTFRTRSSLG